MKIAVVGAGVIGVTCGLKLLEEQVGDVTIIAEKFSPFTTSDIAAALWYPYHAAPQDKVDRWARYTYKRLETLASEPDAGVFWHWLNYFSDDKEDTLENADYLKRAKVDDDIKGWGNYAEKLFVPMVDTTLFMPFIYKLFEKLGGKLQQRNLTTLNEVILEYDVIVNCAGLGNAELVNDNQIYPGRGLILSMTKPDWLNESYVIINEEKLVLAFPRCHDCVIGGTNHLNEWSLEIADEAFQQVYQNVCEVFPKLADEKILEKKVGLRPCRDEVCLYKQIINDKVIIHNYGHGGAGITLSFGCADEVFILLTT